MPTTDEGWNESSERQRTPLPNVHDIDLLLDIAQNEPPTNSNDQAESSSQWLQIVNFKTKS